MSVRIDIDISQLERNQAVTKWLQAFAGQALRESQLLAQQRISGGTGTYERSFRVDLIGGSPPKLRFGNVARHAIYVEEDTVAHDIVPKNVKALRWFSPPGGGEGAAVFSTKAHIPAHKGMHIVRDGVLAAASKLGR